MVNVVAWWHLAMVGQLFHPLRPNWQTRQWCGGFSCRRTALAAGSTSYVERSNLTVRMMNRSFTRLANAFSKKFANPMHAFSLIAMHYNFCKLHKTIRVTPAMEAGLTDHVWEIEELSALVD